MAKAELARETLLDRQYAEMHDIALRIAASYFESVVAAIGCKSVGRDLHVYLLITVRVRSSTSWTVTWSKKVSVRDTEASKAAVKALRGNAKAPSGRYVTREIPKGAYERYPNSVFKSLPVEVRPIAIYYESLLANLRKAAKRNRALRKMVNHSLAGMAKPMTECNAALEGVSEILKAAKESGSEVDFSPLTELFNEAAPQ